jgi:hypothetical protein
MDERRMGLPLLHEQNHPYTNSSRFEIVSCFTEKSLLLMVFHQHYFCDFSLYLETFRASEDYRATF